MEENQVQDELWTEPAKERDPYLIWMIVTAFLICAAVLIYNLFWQDKRAEPVLAVLSNANSVSISTPASSEKADVQSDWSISSGTMPSSGKLASSVSSSFQSKVTSSKNSVSKVETMININLATQQELMELTGIGEVRALAIIAYRELNGPFLSIDDLINVDGIGQATLDKNRHRICV